MQERSVLLLVVVLVTATAGAGVAVNAFRSNDPANWRSFDVSLSHSGTAVVGSPLSMSVSVRQGAVDPKTLWAVYLSLDMGSMDIVSSTPGTNPWGYPTVWNLTSLDLTAPRTFTATGIPTENGSAIVYAMIWVPRGDLRTVSVDPQGHVNPAGVSVMSVETDSFWVDSAS
jgi:hypothetical protein